MAKTSDEPKVTRIKAKDDGAKRVKAAKRSAEVKSVKREIADSEGEKRTIFRRIKEYFEGSWQELTMVRWPDRKSAWKMTGALVMFTLVFAVIILLLDYGFQNMFKVLIGK